jgi:hypothetical protein
MFSLRLLKDALFIAIVECDENIRERCRRCGDEGESKGICNYPSPLRPALNLELALLHRDFPSAQLKIAITKVTLLQPFLALELLISARRSSMRLFFHESPPDVTY